MIEWLNEPENRFFAMHLGAVFVLALASEYFVPAWTLLAFPALILLVSASFMWNYPVKAIKAHGLFSEFVIDLRLLWLVISGLLLEVALFALLEQNSSKLVPAAGLLVGLAIAFIARGRLQERLAAARGFK
jgi:hypothetical protein